jgi:hypothetical protein
LGPLFPPEACAKADVAKALEKRNASREVFIRLGVGGAAVNLCLARCLVLGRRSGAAIHAGRRCYGRTAASGGRTVRSGDNLGRRRRAAGGRLAIDAVRCAIWVKAATAARRKSRGAARRARRIVSAATRRA